MEFTKDISFNAEPTVNQDLTITYNGFLSNSQELYVVYGYGDSWENTSEIKMEKYKNGFVGTVNLLNYDTFNFCFKNSNDEWDNNSYCNYITGITPEVNKVNNFDIDALIEELLFEPILDIENSQYSELDSEQEKNLDLGYQLSTLLSESHEGNMELEEYSTLEEILTAQKIGNITSDNFLQDISVLDFEEDNIYNIEEYNEVYDQFINNISFDNTNNIVEENNAIFEDFINNLSSITAKHQEKNDEYLNNNVKESLSNSYVVSSQKVNKFYNNNTETSLTTSSNSIIVSSRQASKFYLFRKRVKLALYKAFVKLPKMLLGIENEEN